jgi:hypothetical protein
MSEANWPVISDSLRIILLRNKHHKSLIKKMQALLI